ncbi:MAG: 4-oxalocrotonate tautomerase [Clostridia bacterium]|nr:4-oxalocrotonate tautomerase [Clostridia bacterium]
MPHIAVKMLKGRTEEQKKKIAVALTNALIESLSVPRAYISLSIEDYTAEEWQDVFAQEVDNKGASIYVEPDYDPKDLL